MSSHGATIRWTRDGDGFADGRYHRLHRWEFDGGAAIPASSSPAVVPLPMSAAEAVDPEEAFVAALASCHMLWFLSIAQQRGYIVESYTDHAEGIMGRNAQVQVAVTEVVLRPMTAFAGSAPDPLELQSLHDEAHHRCFLAASVRTNIRCEPGLEAAAA